MVKRRKPRKKRTKANPENMDNAQLSDLGKAMGLSADVQLVDILDSEGDPEGMLVTMLTDLATTHGVSGAVQARVPWNDIVKGLLEMKAIDPPTLRASWLRHKAGFRGDSKLVRVGSSEVIFDVGGEAFWHGIPMTIAARVPAAIEPCRIPGIESIEKIYGKLSGAAAEEGTVRAYPSYLVSCKSGDNKVLLWPLPYNLEKRTYRG